MLSLCISRAAYVFPNKRQISGFSVVSWTRVLSIDWHLPYSCFCKRASISLIVSPWFSSISILLNFYIHELGTQLFKHLFLQKNLWFSALHLFREPLIDLILKKKSSQRNYFSVLSKPGYLFVITKIVILQKILFKSPKAYESQKYQSIERRKCVQTKMYIVFYCLLFDKFMPMICLHSSWKVFIFLLFERKMYFPF